MKTQLFIIISVLTLLSPSKAPAYPNWDIYSDANIVDGDEYDDINIYNSASVTMTGGTVDSVLTHNTSKLLVYDGYIRKVDSWDNSTIEISGGTFNSTDPSGNSIISFSGSAQTSGVVVESFGSFDMYGGIATFVGLWGSGVTNLSGGVISDYILATDDSIVNIYGYDLSISTTGGSYGFGQVSGFWDNDLPFTIDLKDSETYDHVNLIPEPSSLILLTLGVLMLRRKE